MVVLYGEDGGVGRAANAVETVMDGLLGVRLQSGIDSIQQRQIVTEDRDPW
jgi:hypothetical protein